MITIKIIRKIKMTKIIKKMKTKMKIIFPSNKKSRISNHKKTIMIKAKLKKIILKKKKNMKHKKVMVQIDVVKTGYKISNNQGMIHQSLGFYKKHFQKTTDKLLTTL